MSTFMSRYADVLDVTLRNALSETRTLYESLVEELQAERCLVKKENEVLRSKYNRLKKQRRIDTASQCDFLHQVPEEQAHLERPEKPAALKCKDDEDREMERLNCRASQPTSDDQLLSSHGSETDSDDSEDSQSSVDSVEEDLTTLKPQNNRSTELEASKQTPFTRGPRVCTICKKICHNTTGLKVHMKIHILEKAYVCTVCGKGWFRKGNLTIHMKQKHTDGKPQLVDRPFSCTVCQTSFKESAHLKMHMNIHTCVNAFICTVCGKKYKYKSGLEMHMRIHTEENTFSCTVCGKGFNQSKHLTTHMRIHTGEKPCVCTVCDRSFCNSKGLNRHMIVHTGNKCFSCIICRKRFYLSTELKEHMVIHTSTPPKPYSKCVETHVDHSYAMAFPFG